MAAVRTADRKSFKVATTNWFTAVYGVKLTEKHSIFARWKKPTQPFLAFHP
jgi:hypothetical protein